MIPCEERDRLTRAYLDAAAKISESGSGVMDKTSAKWKEATSQTRAVSMAALEALNRHKRQHGC